MIDEPLVSIALCTYNGAKHLAEQLDSVIAQTYKNIEVIVVDDCSTDDTFNILKEYTDRYPKFTVYANESNIGFTKNFEKAIGLCQGELIALCDQDDIWHPQKIELQVKSLGSDILIYHDSEFINEDGTPMNKKMSDVLNLYRGAQPETFLFFNCVSGHTILMKKQLIVEALPLKTTYFHDWWLAYVATSIGSIDYLPQCLVQYRQHDRSDTNILRVKRKMEKHRSVSIVKLARTQQWLKYCADYSNNKHPLLINEFYHAFCIRMNSFVSFKLSRLLIKHYRVIFFIRKKSRLNMINYIISQIWGAKAKKIFSKN